MSTPLEENCCSEELPRRKCSHAITSAAILFVHMPFSAVAMGLEFNIATIATSKSTSVTSTKVSFITAWNDINNVVIIIIAGKCSLSVVRF